MGIKQTRRAQRAAAHREHLRQIEQNLLDAVDAGGPGVTETQRELAKQVREHRAAGKYTTQHDK